MAIGNMVLSGVTAGTKGLIGSQLTGFTRGLEYESNVKMPNLVPTFDTLAILWNQGKLSNKHLAELSQMLGIAIGPYDYRDKRSRDGKYKLLSVLWDKIVRAHRNVPTLPEIFILRNRGDITEEVADRWMRQLGYSEDAERSLLESLRFEIPGQSDLVRFAVRDVWQPDIVERFQYDKEFPEAFDYWMKKLGFGGQASFTDKQGRTEAGLSWAKVYWRAHWEVISPTQAYEAFHRLRPNRLHLYRGGGLDPKPFEAEDLKAILKVHDYPIGLRETLAAVAYRPIGRIDLRRLYRDGIFGAPRGPGGFVQALDGRWRAPGPAEGELAERYQDFGYSPSDAMDLARWTAAEWERTSNKPKRVKINAAICQGYHAGAFGKEQGVAALVQAGVPEADAKLEMESCDLKYRTLLLTKTVKTIQRAYRQGVFNERETHAALAQAGMIPKRQDELLALWNLDRLPGVREANTASLCQWLGAGLMDSREFTRRLKNMGWSEVDADRILRHCLMGHLARSAAERTKVLRAQAKEAAAAAKVQERQAKERQRSAETSLQRALAARTEAHLVAWYKDGLLSIGDIRGTLRAKGWAAEDIERFITSQLGVNEDDPEGIADEEEEGAGDGEG